MTLQPNDLDIARRAANYAFGRGAKMPRDECLSSAYYGLVLASTRYRPELGAWRSYAFQWAFQQINEDFRRWHVFKIGLRANGKWGLRPKVLRDTHHDREPSPETATIRRDESEYVRSIVANIPRRQRDVILLTLDGLETEQIAARLGIKIRAVYLHRQLGVLGLRARL